MGALIVYLSSAFLSLCPIVLSGVDVMFKLLDACQDVSQVGHILEDHP